jgi:uncharacterized membrane protein
VVNPFDLKSALLAKHAQHVVLIHFPIALFLTGVGFDLVAQWTRRAKLAAAAYCNLMMAAVSVVPVLATGILAWQWQLEGGKLKGIVLLHLVAGCTSAALIWLVAWIHIRKRGTDSRLPVYRWPLELLTVALVMVTGHLGGFLSGVNGPS